MINEKLLIFTASDYAAMAPYLTLFVGVNLVIILSIIKKLQRFEVGFWASLLCLVLPLFMTASQLLSSPITLFNGMLVVDAYARFFNFVVLFAAAVVVFISRNYLKNSRLNYPEYYILILFSALGMMLMFSTLDLIVMFIGIELMSLTVYTLVAFKRDSRICNESAIKYFIVGSTASALFLFGVAHLYGTLGSFNLSVILEKMFWQQTGMSTIALLGIVFLLVGVLIKIAAVPFHMWMPDVYEGAITPITGFMTTALKVSVFAMLIRVTASLDWAYVLEHQPAISTVLWVSAFVTMLGANITALTQTNLKRMLGYSSIAHTGYLLIGFIAVPFSEIGYAAIVTYLVAYVIMNLGAFVVLSYLGHQNINPENNEVITLQSVSGLVNRSPFMAFALATFLFSLAGIPPTVGFIGKYYLFYSGIAAGHLYLIIAAVLSSAIAAYYYLRVIVYMYMKPVEGPAGDQKFSLSMTAIVPVGVLVLLTIAAGLFPAGLLNSVKAILTTFGNGGV